MLRDSSGCCKYMRKVLTDRPMCVACGEKYQCLWDIDSFAFGNIIVCQACCVRVATYLAANDLLDSNPFAQALLDNCLWPDEPMYTAYADSGMSHPALVPIRVTRVES